MRWQLDSTKCGVVEAARPLGLVEGNWYDTSVAAEIMVAKYAYYSPVYRPQDLFTSHGGTPSKSTLLNVLEAAAHLIGPSRSAPAGGGAGGTDYRHRRHDSDARRERLSIGRR